MSSTQDMRSSPPVSEGFTGPGSQLRRARENHSLSIDSVAAQLHVLPKIIAALEAEDYAKLPSPVFVRGYLRSYAKVVGLSPEPLIESYNRVAGGELELTPAEPEDAEERPMRWSLYVGVLAGLVAAVLWVNRDGLVQYGSGPASPADEVAALPPVAEPVVRAPEPSEAPLAPQPAVIAEQPVDAPAPPVAEVKAPPPTAMPAAEPSAAKPAREETVASTIGQGPDQLTVRISEDSWVAIRDASGQRLIYGKLSAGTVKTIRGEAPFALVLGNASAAQVEFNGQSVDHSKYTVGAVARFKILK